MKIRLAGTLDATTLPALARAKSYHGPQPRTEYFAGCLIQYRNDTATILPLPVSQHVPVYLVNPVPYRGVFLGTTTSWREPVEPVEPALVKQGLGSSPVYRTYGTIGPYGYPWTGHGQIFTSEGAYFCDWFFIEYYDGEATPSVASNTPQYGPDNNIASLYSGSYPNYTFSLVSEIAPDATLQPAHDAWVVAHAAWVVAHAAWAALPEVQRGPHNVVMTSDSTVLASEAQVITTDSPPHTQFAFGSTVWDGSGAVKMYEQVGASSTYNHDLSFPVPEDCIYPENAGVSVPKFYTRRTAWFKKNSDTVLTQLQNGTFSSPAWDYALKANAPLSGHAVRIPVLTASVHDSNVSDTSGNGAHEGVQVTSRVVNFIYTLNEKLVSAQIIGFMRVVTTDYKSTAGMHLAYLAQTTYENWYVDASPGFFAGVIPAGREQFFAHQFLSDMTDESGGLRIGMGLCWNGVVTTGHQDDSSLGNTPAYPSALSGTYVPPYPVSSNTLVGTAPQFILDYRNAVHPTYNTHYAGAWWCDSSPTGGVKIILFGPTGKGMFGVWTQSDTSLDVYGAARFSYDYATGAFKFVSFTKPKDVDGNEVGFVTIPLNGAAAPFTNALVKYSGLKWPDVVAAASTAEALLKPPKVTDPPTPDTRTPDQKLVYAVLSSV